MQKIAGRIVQKIHQCRISRAAASVRAESQGCSVRSVKAEAVEVLDVPLAQLLREGFHKGSHLPGRPGGRILVLIVLVKLPFVGKVCVLQIHDGTIDLRSEHGVAFRQEGTVLLQIRVI